MNLFTYIFTYFFFMPHCWLNMMAAVTRTGVPAPLEIQMRYIITSNETVIMVMMLCARFIKIENTH